MAQKETKDCIVEEIQPYSVIPNETNYVDFMLYRPDEEWFMQHMQPLMNQKAREKTEANASISQTTFYCFPKDTEQSDMQSRENQAVDQMATAFDKTLCFSDKPQKRRYRGRRVPNTGNATRPQPEKRTQDWMQTVQDVEKLAGNIDNMHLSPITDIAFQNKNILLDLPFFSGLKGKVDTITDENNRECIICYNNKANVALVSCGHVNFCISCALSYFSESGRIKPQEKLVCPTCDMRVSMCVAVFSD